MACSTTVHDSICVDAEVTISPIVTVGEVHSYCMGDAAIGVCPENPSTSCTFHVRQEICVQVPLTFEADATAVPLGVVCGTPDIGLCDGGEFCTYTIGYFKTHSDVITFLLSSAGGSIVLGDGTTGLYYTVTNVAEAIAVLNFMIPSTTALPTTPAYAVHYRVLYAQLLAAKLNVLNGAVCSYATTAITNADGFLAASPPAGVAGASAFQEALALYNNGNASGCPSHCS